MRFLSGFLGAAVGTVTGGALTAWIVTRAFRDNELGAALFLVTFGLLCLLTGLIAGVLCALKAFDFLHRPDPNGTLRVKKKRLQAALVLGPLVAIFLPLYSLMHEHDPPSDAVMLTHFAAHRAQLDELAQMAQQDKHVVGLYSERVNYDSKRSPHMPAARLAEYLKKLKEAGVPSGFRTGYDADEIEFLFWNYSKVSEKDFAYLPKPPSSIFSSLDSYAPHQDGIPVYRHIEGPWYLSYVYPSD